MHDTATRTASAVFIAALLALAPGCSVREIAARSVADALSSGGDAYASEADIELVGAAVPFGLKTMESLLATVPEHRGLLLAACRGFTQYAYVYVQSPADELEQRDVAAAYEQRARARRLYLRARDYGLRGLGLDVERMRLDPAEAVDGMQATDVPLLYWTALAWGAAISLSKDDPGTVAGLPSVEALIRRAAVLDIDWDAGALRTFLIGYEVNRPNARPDALELARQHYARALDLTGGQQAGVYVALAEAIAASNGRRAEYDALLKRALAVDPDRRPEWRLANLVMQRRARQLLARADELFAE